MLGIDTCQEWLLVILELLGLIAIGIIGLSLAIGMFFLYFGKTIWFWDLDYFREDC